MIKTTEGFKREFTRIAEDVFGTPAEKQYICAACCHLVSHLVNQSSFPQGRYRAESVKARIEAPACHTVKCIESGFYFALETCYISAHVLRDIGRDSVRLFRFHALRFFDCRIELLFIGSQSVI